jgi:hypothetical protein
MDFGLSTKPHITLNAYLPRGWPRAMAPRNAAEI